MNRKQHSVVLASLLALALAGCSSTRGSSDEMGSGATASGTGTGSSGGTAATSGSTGSSTTPGTSGSSSTASTTADQYNMPGAAGQTTTSTATPNAMVMAIEAMPRPSTAGAGSAAMGTSGTAGATGSSPTGEQMYRITLRMDDGTTRVVTQDKAPTFRNGDRVNMTDGTITK